MNLRIRRRQFGQLALASVTTAAIANFATKTVAQQPPQLVGVRLSSSSQQYLSSLLTLTSSNAANNTPEITLLSLDLATGVEKLLSNVVSQTVDNVITSRPTNNAVSIRRDERLTGLTNLSDGTIIVASVGSVFSHLIFTDINSSQAKRALNVSGFQNNRSTLESLLATKDDQILSLISLNQGTPPFSLAIIDSNTGVVTFGEKLGLPDLQTGARFSNLTQRSDGTIIALTIPEQGSTSLVQLDLNNKQIINLPELTLDNQPLTNDLLGLAFSPSDQLYAIANPKYEATNSLYIVNVNTGEMTLLSKFNAAKITFARF